jgi:hypothetical protein
MEKNGNRNRRQETGDRKIEEEAMSHELLALRKKTLNLELTASG